MRIRILLIFSVLTLLNSCNKKSDDSTSYSVDTTEEVGQQVGEAMAAVDESGGTSNGGIALIEPSGAYKTFSRLSGENNSRSKLNFAWDKLITPAYAAACSTVTFGTCGSTVANAKVKDFSSCTLGIGATITGSIQLAFSGSAASSCQIPNNTDSVTRTPNFTITGARGATFKVAVPTGATGQTLTRTGGSTFTFSNSGIQRSFTTAAGSVLLDVTTKTTSDISISGSSRASRQVTGGVLQVTNNLNGQVCTISPSSVQWTSTCNCPTSGSWTGSCSSGETLTVAFSSTCGSSTVTLGSDVKTVTLDRCNL